MDVTTLLVATVSVVIASEQGSVTFINVTSTGSRIDVKSCAGNGQYSNAIFEEELTWFQAEQTCGDIGYTGLDNAPIGWRRRLYSRQYLAKHYNHSLAKYWVGAYRVVPGSDTWHILRGDRCNGFQSPVNSINSTDMCAFLQIDESRPPWEALEVFSADCFQKHPYICHLRTGDFEFHAYDNFTIVEITDYTAYTVSEIVSSFNACRILCANMSTCTSFLYSHDNGSCLRVRVNDGYGVAELAIASVTDNVTFATRIGCEFAYFDSSTTNMPGADDSFSFNLTTPVCPQTTTPLPDACYLDGYCQCDANYTSLSHEELDEVVKELISNLTVVPKATSAYKRTKISAQDPRPASQAVGAVAIAITVVILSLPILSDIVTWKWKHSASVNTCTQT